MTGSSLIESFIFTIMQAILMCSPFLQRWILRTGKSLALQLHKCQVERKSNKAGLIICKTWSKPSFYLKSYIWVLRPQNKMALLFACTSTASNWGCSYCSYIRVSLPFKSLGSVRIKKNVSYALQGCICLVKNEQKQNNCEIILLFKNK